MKKTYSRRILRAYESYKKMYHRRKMTMRRHGLQMNDTRLTLSEYNTNRKALIAEMKEETGKVQNINQTLVSQQQYKYDRETGRRFLNTARELGLDWDESLLRDIRAGTNPELDVSAINNALKGKEGFAEGRDRARYIAHYVFGSE